MMMPGKGMDGYSDSLQGALDNNAGNASFGSTGIQVSADSFILLLFRQSLCRQTSWTPTPDDT